MRFPIICATVIHLLYVSGWAAERREVTAGEARAAVTRYIPLLEGTLQTFKCTAACHHRLGLMVYGMARERSLPVHDRVFSKAIDNIQETEEGLLEPFLQGIGEPEPGMVGYYALTARAAYHPDPVAPFLARWIASRQRVDGSWGMITHRPPMQDSDFTATALSIRLLQLEMPARAAAEKEVRIGWAKNWLLIARALSTEDQAFRVLGLRWAGAGSRDIADAAQRLIAEQRSDGGWGQFEHRASDAYATGLTLYALREGAGLPIGHKAYQSGLRFLLKTQLADGSWLVSTRHHPPTPGIPYVESGFPHNESQFISCAGSNWAAMALLSVLPKSTIVEPILARPDPPPWLETVMFGSADDLRSLLDGGLSPNATTKHGTSILMLSVNDKEKVKLLLQRGGNVNAKAASGATALMVAAGLTRNLDAFRLLLDAGADIHAVAENGETVLGVAVTGESEKVALLLAKGADANRRFVQGGVAPILPLQTAVAAGDREMVELLVSNRAGIDGHLSSGFPPPLSMAVIAGRSDMVKLLTSLGANVNQVDDLGMTPLLWSAISDYGEADMTRALIDAGADPGARDKNGQTALLLADKFQVMSVSRELIRLQNGNRQ